MTKRLNKPKVIGYEIDENRKKYSDKFFEIKAKPKKAAIEEFHRKFRRYPIGIKPIYEKEKNERRETANA